MTFTKLTCKYDSSILFLCLFKNAFSIVQVTSSSGHMILNTEFEMWKKLSAEPVPGQKFE
jgi:hypothetical protein